MTMSLGVDTELNDDGLLRLALALVESAIKDGDWTFLRSKACERLLDFIIEELEKQDV